MFAECQGSDVMDKIYRNKYVGGVSAVASKIRVFRSLVKTSKEKPVN